MGDFDWRRVVVYPEYIAMIERAAKDFGVANIDWANLRNQFPKVTSTPRRGNKDIILSLEVDGRYPICWEAKGKVFEIVGPNNRNKTTTLVYIATLLGLDWERMEPYLEDKELIKRGKEIMGQLGGGRKAHLTVEDPDYRFVLDIANGLATGSFWVKPENDRKLYFEDLSLEGEGDWEEYRNKVGNLFDVQFVGKGRNFIAQVGFEEASNLSGFCKQIANTVECYSRLLNQSAPRRTPSEIEKRIAELKRWVESLQIERRDVRDKLTQTAVKLKQLEDDLAFIDQHLKNEDFRELIDVDIKLSVVRGYEKKLHKINEEIITIQKEINQLEESIRESSTHFSRINNIMEGLCDLYDGVQHALQIPKEISDAIRRVLTQKDVDEFMTLLHHLEIGDETQKAHDALSEFSPPAISVDTKLIGIAVFGQRVSTLREFRRYMKKAKDNAILLAPMQDNIRELKKELKALSINNSGEFSRLKSLLEDLETTVVRKEKEIYDLERQEVEIAQKLERELTPYASVEELLARRDVLIDMVDTEVYRSLLDKIQLWTLT